MNSRRDRVGWREMEKEGESELVRGSNKEKEESRVQIGGERGREKEGMKLMGTYQHSVNSYTNLKYWLSSRDESVDAKVL